MQIQDVMWAECSQSLRRLAHTFASGLFMKVPAMGCLFPICLP